jgi:DNA-binding LacI/PurR family transcriptional regulator
VSERAIGRGPSGPALSAPRAGDTANGCTLEDVAARAGVSRATASRVINGGRRVAAPTRQAVEAAIAELGYAPNRAARSLAAHRSDTVALVVSEPTDRLFSDPFYGQTILGAASVLGATDYQLVLVMVQGDDDRDRVERHLLRGNAAGVLLLSTRHDDPLPARLHDAGVACVLGGRPSGDLPLGYVDADNVGGARRAVAHLVSRGCRVVATVAGPAGKPPGADRLAGWRDGLLAAGLPAPLTLVAGGDFTRAGGRAATDELLARHPDLDGLFVASDLMALGALDALRRAGRRVPGDVAVVGFDDSEAAAAADPPLTTVRQPIEALGRRMAGALLDQLDRGAAPTAEVLRTELVIRSST